MKAGLDYWKLRENDSRGRIKCGPKCKADGSSWIELCHWTEAEKSCPVYGYLVLIADAQGRVHVLDLRHPANEKPGDVSHEVTFARTRDALKIHGAKWWAYLPTSPPRNVKAMPWRYSKSGKPIPRTAKDPKRLFYTYNQPNEYLLPDRLHPIPCASSYRHIMAKEARRKRRSHA